VNGGEVTWRDASKSVEADRSLIVVAGSGRTADILANAVRGQSTDKRAAEIVSSGLVRAIDLEAGTNAFAIMIEEIFASGQ
jgi:ATP-dependent protease HslVU (ClpYQ) peptidase subunit